MRASCFVLLLILACGLTPRTDASSRQTPPSPPPGQFEPYSGQPGKDVVWVPTSPDLVEKMLDMARVTPDDFVVDLGSGDGRNVIAAAKRGARGLGVEFNPDMVALSRQHAARAGVADKATFVEGDMYAAEFSRATVLALFLLPNNLERLRPKFLDLAPGTRIVANTFGIPGWDADQSETIDGDCDSWCTSLLWIVPAKAHGSWRLDDGELAIEQTFQKFSGRLTQGGTRTSVEQGALRGSDISFVVAGDHYTGRVNGDTIEGTVTRGGTSAPWRAMRQASKNDYAKGESWLCRPNRQDACAVDQATTAVAANGRLTREAWKPNPKAPIDCFYVYPTVSLDPTPNSDMTAGPEETRVIAAQFARFGSVCRVYAPLYRQATLTQLRAATAGKPMAVDRTLAYNDVVDAWNHYLEHDNKGRGVVLVGHSQGSGVLSQVIRNEIDGKPVQSKLVSALLLGANVAVPRGKDVGGAFKSIPLCRSAQQTGCVISYVTFRSTVPPPSDSRFGKVQGEGLEAACTNPAALGGGKGPLKAHLTSAGSILTGSSAQQRPWVTPPKEIETPFVSVPGLLTAQCVSNEKGSYLEVTVNADPNDPRTDEIAGDVMTNGQVNPSWGLHLIDVQVAMGSLVDIVREQSKNYRAAGTKH